MKQMKTQEQFEKELKEKQPNLELLSKYEGNKNKITCRCVTHDYIFTKGVYGVIYNGCPKCNGNIIFFSRKEKLEKGVYLDENNNIVIDIDEKIVLLNKKELSLPGAHNLENCMAAIAMSYVCNVDLETLKHVLRTFKAVEHRLEYVRTLNDIKFVNDSKGTNPDSTIKAITSYENPVILIAGGYNKESDFNELLEIGKENVKALVLMGETADIIEQCAKEKNYKTIIRVNNMREAVEASYNLAEGGDVVLLSPACASWDMYKSFEARGCDFKDNVNNLK